MIMCVAQNAPTFFIDDLKKIPHIYVFLYSQTIFSTPVQFNVSAACKETIFGIDNAAFFQKFEVNFTNTKFNSGDQFL